MWEKGFCPRVLMACRTRRSRQWLVREQSRELGLDVDKPWHPPGIVPQGYFPESRFLATLYQSQSSCGAHQFKLDAYLHLQY